MILLDCIVNFSSFVAFDVSGNLYLMIRSKDLDGGLNDAVKFLREVNEEPAPTQTVEIAFNVLCFQSAEKANTYDKLVLNTCILNDTVLNTTVETFFP